MGRVPRRTLATAMTLAALAAVLPGCTLFDTQWGLPNDTRGAADRPDALLRALLVAESRISPATLDAYRCAGVSDCPQLDELATAVDEETSQIVLALAAQPDDCLAETARIDLESYDAVRRFAAERGSDAAYEAAGRGDELKVQSYAASVGCAFLPGEVGEVEQHVRQAIAPLGVAVIEALTCGEPAGCNDALRAVATDARAASERLQADVDTLGEGCDADIARATHGFLERYAQLAEAYDSEDGGVEMSFAFEEADSALQRQTVLCLDELQAAG